MAHMISPKVSYEVRGDVAVVTVINPPVNALHVDVYKGLEASIKAAEEDANVKGVVLTGKGNKAFIAGADIKAFSEMFSRSEEEVRNNNREMNKIFDRIEEGPKPWVAALNGIAFGGGLEFAMMCSHRVAVPSAAIGLPELKLGLLPGLGGTQRLPRLIGVQNAVRAMLESQTIPAEKAKKLGAIDSIVAPEALMDTAIALARAIGTNQEPRHYALKKTDKLEMGMIVKQIISMATNMANKKAPEMVQAPACLRAIAAGVTGNDGREVEAAEFAKLAKGPVSKSLIHVFISERATSKVSGVTDAGLKPRTINSVGVVGGGLMGSGIATALITRGIPVLLKEINQKFLDAGVARIRSNFESRVKKGKMTKEKMEKLMALVSPVLTYDRFKEVDIVIEAAVEKVELKQTIFAELERVCNPNCILATNTSTIDIDLVGLKTKAQDRIVGAHFFSPAHVMPLLEIVRGTHTSPQVLLDVLVLGTRIKKTPVVVGSCPGFAVNRTFFPYTMTAGYLVAHGANLYHVDKLIKQLGMPMGPFRLGDLVGNGLGKLVGATYVEKFGHRMFQNNMTDTLIELNRLGESTGKGYYKYDKGSRKEKEDPEMLKLVEEMRAKKGYPNTAGSLSDKDIVEAIFFPVINEACRILAEGHVDKASDLDIAAIFGMGFPARLGGPLHWADQLGARYVYDRLKHFEAMFGHNLFAPCEHLEQCARTGAPVSRKPVRMSDEDIVIVSGRRTAIGRAKRGGFNITPMDDLIAVAIRKAMEDVPEVKPETIGDVVVGTVLGSMGASQARTAMLLAGLPVSVPARTVNRQCSSGLQTIADVAAAIQAGQYEVGIACGAESMSSNAMMPKDFKPNPAVLKNRAAMGCYLSMGQTSENVAAKFGVSREVQDRFAAESHAKAEAAQKAGKLSYIVPVTTTMMDYKTKETRQVTVTQDEGVRPGTTVESLATLKAVFKADGSTTAGNASQTSDGASAVVLMKRGKAKQLGLKPLASLRSFYVAGCDPAIMGIGPAVAIPGALSRAGLGIEDVEVYEINEAFASQATYCVNKLGINPAKVNPNGGAIAIGHPLGMSGNRMTVDIIHELQRRGGGYGVVSMCIGTGMGAAAVFHVE